MTFYRARSVEMQVLDNRPIIATIDGECAPVMELKAEVLPSALNVLLPRPACGSAVIPWAARMPDAGKSKIKPWQTRQNKALIAVLEIKSAANWPGEGKICQKQK